MSIICLVKHNWSPIKAFYTSIIDNNGEVTSTRESWTGYECLRCNKRKIIKDPYVAQSAGATQQAYDWLNEKYEKQKDLNI